MTEPTIRNEPVSAGMFFRIAFVCGGLDRNQYVTAFMLGHANGMIETVFSHPAQQANLQVDNWEAGNGDAADYVLREWCVVSAS